MSRKVKLPKLFRKQWIAALLSGKFKQGKGSLIQHLSKRHYTYCCLGVACRVGGIKPKDISGSTINESFRSMDVKIGTALHNAFVKRNKKKFEGRLATMNDDQGLSFKQIASWIKTHTVGV